MKWTKRKLTVTGLACAMGAGLLVAYGQTQKTTSPKVEVIAGTPPPSIQSIERRLAGSMVFVDPVTGEIRSPEAGEHGALTGASSARIAATPAGPQAVAGPNGMYSIAPETMRMEYMTAVQNADGTLTYRCENPAHKHTKGGGNAR